MSSIWQSTAAVAGIGVAAVISAAYLAKGSGTPFKSNFDIEHQSIELEDGTHIHAALQGPDQVIEYVSEEAKTVAECLRRGARISKNGKCLGYRPGEKPYEWINYNEVIERAEVIGSGLISLGCNPGESTFVAIYAQNRPEWVICEHGCYSYSMAVIALYDTLGKEATQYILDQTSCTTVICDSSQKVENLLEHAEDLPNMRNIVKMDEITQEEKEKAEKLNINLLHLSQLEALGRKEKHELQFPTADSLATLCYTSGTTGQPKGAMLTHRNVVACAAGAYMQMKEVIKFCPDDMYFSYLPLAHMLERTVQTLMFCEGCQVAFFRGDIKLLLDDLQFARPTLFASVPRLLNRIYDKVLAGAAQSPIKKAIFDMALKYKEREVERGVIRQNSVWDSLVFKKVQARLGGRVRLVVSGAAPLSTKVLSFLRAALGVPVLEGYGQTEATSATNLNLIGDPTVGHCGPPSMSVMIKLVDVPDMDYYVKDNKGEICFKGPICFKGYYNQPEKTAATIDADGWIHSGDIGEWLSNGGLKIIDRIKHIFKLSQGEYIAPEKIENIYIRSPLVAQVFVYGDSFSNFLVGIVVPDEENVLVWASKHGLEKNFEGLCANGKLNSAVMSDFARLAKESGLKSFEQVKNITFHGELFSVENGLLTPTFKAKRPVLKRFFDEQIKQMYGKSS